MGENKTNKIKAITFFQMILMRCIMEINIELKDVQQMVLAKALRMVCGEYSERVKYFEGKSHKLNPEFASFKSSEARAKLKAAEELQKQICDKMLKAHKEGKENGDV